MFVRLVWRSHLANATISFRNLKKVTCFISDSDHEEAFSIKRVFQAATFLGREFYNSKESEFSKQMRFDPNVLFC